MSQLPPGPAEVRRDLLWLVSGAAVLFMISLGARDLWNPNEPIYGQAVVEMSRRGDWLIPTINGETFNEKPILYFWLALAVGRVFGEVNELTLRLPSAAAGVVAVVLVYLLVHPYAGRVRARLAAVLLATTYVVFWSARAVQMDLLLTACTLGTVLAVTRIVDRRAAPARGWMLAGLGAGLGFLAKGPPGLLGPVLILLPYVLSRGRARVLVGPATLIFCVTLLLVAAPWGLMLWARDEAGFLYEALYRQSFTRFVDPWDHQAPWWYYLSYFWIDMAPWSIFVPLAVALPDRDRDERRLDRLAWIWIAALVLFFSFSASKRSVYILPAAPAVAILVSGLAVRLLDGRLDRARARIGYLLFGLLGLLLSIAAGYLQLEGLARYPLLGLAGQATVLLLLAGGAAILSSLLVRPVRRVAAPAACLAFVVSLYLLAAVLVLPAADVYKSPRRFCDEVNAQVGPDDVLRSYDLWKWRSGYSYYTGRTISRVTSTEELEAYWRSPQAVYLIVERGRVDEVKSVIGDADPLVASPIGSNYAYLFSNRRR